MRILVVEDEHKIAAAIKKGLELEKYAVDLAYDGLSGYDLASSEEYDLLVVDIMLPKMDGISLCSKLRAARIHTPILILTAKGQIQDKVLGLDSGADDYLTKPFNFEEFLARIRALIRRPQQSLGAIIAVSDLTLNTKTYQVNRKDQSIPLTAKEFSLLHYLMRNSEQIISKNQIISHVWDYDSEVLPNTVEVYIKNLRTKVDAPFPQSPALIHTVRGFGYKLSPHTQNV